MNRQEGARNQPKKFFKEILKNPLTTNANYDIMNTEIRERKPLKTRKETKTMTMKELLTALTEGTTVTAEMEERAKEALAKAAAEAEARAQKAAEKRSAEDAPLVEKATELLNDHTVRTAAEIATALGVKTPKATALMRKVVGVKVTEVIVGNRVVKGYSL